MSTCIYCSGRKGKRSCPALGGEICQQCCGKHRLVAISCPADCRWLHGLEIVRERPTAFTKEQYVSACERLFAFVQSASNAREYERALAILEEDLPDEAEPTQAVAPLLHAFFAYGDRGTDDLRAVDRFVQRYGHGLSSGERAALAALQEAWASVFEIEAVAIGAGFTLRDRLRDELVEVREVTASAQLRRGDTLFAWLMRVDDHVELTGAAIILAQDHIDPVLRALREELELIHRESGEEVPRKVVGEIADLVIITLAELTTAQRPKVVTTHGEEMLFCEAHYDVHDVERLRAKLASQPTLQAQATDDYVWVDRRPNKALGGGGTVLGRIHHDERTLVLETQSRERLERGRALLQRLAGKALVHKVDTFADLESKLRDHTSRPSPEPEIPAEVQAEHAAAFLREYYLERWVREPIPMLDGKTPRAAARSKEGRARVASMIDEAERMSRDMPGGDDPGLWDELRASLKISPRVRAGTGLGYDADIAPDPTAWMAADEDVRIAAVSAAHDRLGSHPPMPDPRLHALMHVIVENQLAAGEAPEATTAVARLVADGASRHAAIHAVAAVVAEEMQAMMKANRAYDRETTRRRLAKLQAKDWIW